MTKHIRCLFKLLLSLGVICQLFVIW